MRILIPLLLLAFPLRLMADNALRIVADIPPTAMAIERINATNADANLEISILLPENADAHHFALKPSQARMLEDADFVIGIGTIFMPEFVEAAERLAPNAKRLFYHDDFILKNSSTAPTRPNDPHYWLSPEHVDQLSSFIAQALNMSAPEALNWSNPLKITETPYPLISSHDAFGYFEDYAGVKSQGALNDAQGNALPPRLFAQLDEKIKAGEIRCLLSEATEHSHDIEHFAEDENLALHEFDLLGWTWLQSPDFFTAYYDSLAQIYLGCRN